MLNIDAVPLDTFDASSFKTIYMIDVVMNGGLPFSLSMGSSLVADKITGSETLADAVQRVVMGTGGKKEKFGILNPNLKSPKKPNKMSFRANKECHIIYRLPFGSGLRYAIDHPPILRDPSIAKGILGNTKFVDASGTILPDGAQPNDCRHILISFNGKAATPPAGDDFIGMFNLYVDVLDDPADCNSGHIPMVLDPDVRWPGGKNGGGGLIDFC